MVESWNDEIKGEDDDDLDRESHVALDGDSDGEDSDGKGGYSDGENEVLIEALCGEKRKQVL